MGELEKYFLTGVNYWPREKAMYWWKNFDPKEVNHQFAEIESLSLKLVRIFLLWEDFQPKPKEISQVSLKNLENVLDIASKHDLKLLITFFTGHISGINWIPEWALNKKSTEVKRIRFYPSITNGKVSKYSIKNLFEDPLMREAEKLQIRTIVSKFLHHPGLWGWDLSNEVSNLYIPRSSEVAKSWIQILAGEIRKIDTAHPIVCGTHTEDIERDRGFRQQDISLFCDYPIMHGYPMFCNWAKDPLDSDLVPFLNVLTESLSKKPVLFEEFGLATVPLGQPARKILSGERTIYMATEREASKYYSQVLEKLYQIGSVGALAWCFSDYTFERPPWKEPPLNDIEMHMGLTRTDGSLKPHAEILQSFTKPKRKIKLSPFSLRVSEKNYFISPYETLKKYYESFKNLKINY